MSSKILVVEDSPELRRAAKVALESRGYEVVCSEDGQDGLADFLAHKPDLVLLDIRMPRISGIELCGLIRHRSRVPIVMYSAVEDRDDVIRAIRNGATDYVLKDTGIMELLERVGSRLAQAQAAPKSDREPSTRPSPDVPVQLFSLRKNDKATAVLVHSDEEARAELLQVLRRTGRQVIEAGTGDEGIEAIRSQNPELVVFAWSLDDVNGLELLKTLNRHPNRRKIAAIAVSNKRSHEAQRRAAYHGVQDFVLAPFNDGRADLAIRTALAKILPMPKIQKRPRTDLPFMKAA